MIHAGEVIVITSCTNRKKKIGTVLALADVENARTVADLARTWKRQVESVCESELRSAADLYGGRSITEAKRAAEKLPARLYIVSAGHGLVRSDEHIPSYNVTVSAASDNLLHRCLLRFGQSPADWWQALIEAFGEHRSLAKLLADSASTVVLLAVPSTYLILLADELAELSDTDVQRLRILTSLHGASCLPPRLRSAVLPYDERLEGLPEYAGTRSDFPQRALRHFVTALNGHEVPPELAHQRVRHTMNTLEKPALPVRQRRTDDEITALLRQNWVRFNGSATALLRYLRDDALVACEQSRFRVLRQRALSELHNDTHIHG